MGTFCRCITPSEEEHHITFYPQHQYQFVQECKSSRKTAPILQHQFLPFKKHFQEEPIDQCYPKTSRNNPNGNSFKNVSSAFSTTTNFKEDEMSSTYISKIFTTYHKHPMNITQSLDNIVTNRLVIQVTSQMNQIKQELFITPNEILLTSDILNNKIDENDIIYDSFLYIYDNDNNKKSVVYVILYKSYFGVYDPQNSFSYEQIEKIYYNDIINIKSLYRNKIEPKHSNKRDFWFMIILKEKEISFGSEDTEAKKIFKVLNFIMQNVIPS